MEDDGYEKNTVFFIGFCDFVCFLSGYKFTRPGEGKDSKGS
jgi:hypothetical protein